MVVSMQQSFISKTVTPMLLMAAILLAGCSSTQSAELSTDLEPAWLSTPPAEAQFVYGIGVDPDPAAAKQKAIVNVGQQLSSRITATVETGRLASGTDVRTILSTVNRQLTAAEVVGAKFADQYLDGKGRTWILSRAPLDCVLDVTEGILLSYLLKEESQAPLQLRIQEALQEVQTSLEDSALPYYEGMAEGIVKVAPGTIEVDGDISDWIIPPIAVDEVNDASMGRRDISKVYLASDDTYIYVRVDFREGRPMAASSDVTYDLTFSLEGARYELWCLKANMSPAVNVGGNAGWRQQTGGCRTRTEDGHLEARFPWESIAIEPGKTLRVSPAFRVRDGGGNIDRVELPQIEL